MLVLVEMWGGVWAGRGHDTAGVGESGHFGWGRSTTQEEVGCTLAEGVGEGGGWGRGWSSQHVGYRVGCGVGSFKCRLLFLFSFGFVVMFRNGFGSSQ